MLATSVLAVVFCGLGLGPAGAQSPTAAISGEIVDPQHAALPAAAVTVVNVQTGLARNTVSDRAGRFRLPALPPGDYRLLIELPGFAPYKGSDLRLTMDQEAQITVTLNVATAVSVTVTADLPNIDTSKTTLSQTFTTQQIQELPVPGRDFAQFALLVPGVFSNQTQAPGTAGSPVAAAGQHGRNNAFLLDGLPLDDTMGPSIRGTLPLDAIRELTVASNGFGAEYGLASGAVISVLTRSGTNEYAGRGFYYHRDEAWDATPPLARRAGLEKSPLEQKSYGGSLGGPLSRNQAFFFGSVDHTTRDSEFVVSSPAALQVFRPGEPPNVPLPFRGTQAVGRGDATIGDGNQLTGRYRLDFNKKARFDSKDAPERGIDDLKHAQDGALIFKQRVRSAGFNEIRLQFLDWRFGFDPYCKGCASEQHNSINLGKGPNLPQHRTERRWQFSDTFTYRTSDHLGEHAFKLGIEASTGTARFDLLANRDGTFEFNSDKVFNAEDPETFPTKFTLTSGYPLVRLGHAMYALFVEDRWQPRSNLTVNLGLRWDYDTAVGISRDRDNFAPRIGVAFDPWRTGRQSIRATYGVYYDQFFLVIPRDAEESKTATRIVIDNPDYRGWPNPKAIRTTTPLPNVLQLSERLRTPYAQEFSFGGQLWLRGQIALSADVVSARGYNLFRRRDANYPDLDSPLQPRPNPAYLKIEVTESEARSWYKALQVGVQKRQSNHHSYTVAYTLSRSEREAEDWNSVPQDHRDPSAERGPSVNDVRHRLSTSGTLDAPFGFRLAAVLAVQSALPYNLTTGRDGNRDGYSMTDRPAGVSRNSERGYDFWQVDVRVSKLFASGRRRIEVLAEAFNIANRVNWTSVDGREGATFGAPLSAATPREVQIGIRLSF